MDVKLNLINQSNSSNNTEIVIFSKNVETDFEEMATAWQVIKHLGQGDYHPFVYPSSYSVSTSDSWGNYTPQMDAMPGEVFAMAQDASGDVLMKKGTAASAQEIDIRNDLAKGAINAYIYKDAKLFCEKCNIAPAEKAVFEFKPTIWIGVASQIEEGQVMNSAIISEINTEISLLGIASADIVMTGGGAGPDSQPFTFTLQNVVMV